MPMSWRGLQPAAAGALIALALQGAGAFPLSGDQTVLPAGADLNEEALDRPREVFHSEADGGRRSYLVNLGNLAFSSPSILGGVARQAGVSCGTCHVNGASNPRLYVPGLSTRPGTFDTTGPLFNPKADNKKRDAVRIPSLRGARYLGPYGHDGRTASLRDFVRDVIVTEFAGPEPAPALVDALVAYIKDIDFLYNPDVGPGGRLTVRANDAARRGEALFSRPFPHDPQLSCAGCHIPSSAFVDNRRHDVGSGGLFKTPTLLNANFNAPYFHDGRFDTYDEVVAHFDRVFDLGLSEPERRDLVAYMNAAGNAALPYEHDGVGPQFREIEEFAAVLDGAIAAHDADVIGLAVQTIGGELRELAEHFPDRKDTSISGGLGERLLARSSVKELVLRLRRIEIASSAGRFDDAAAEYKAYRNLAFAAVPMMVSKAEPWSLFNPQVHAAHYTAMRRMLPSAPGP